MMQVMEGAPNLQDMVMSVCEPARESDLESYTSVQQVSDQMLLMHQIGAEEEGEGEVEDEYRDTISGIISSDIQSASIMYYEIDPTRSHSRSSTDLNTSSCSRSSSFDTRINGVGRRGGAGCGNKPHKAQDGAWEAICRVKVRDGGLGLGHFRFLQRLGSGDIGSVYLAELKTEEEEDEEDEGEEEEDEGVVHSTNSTLAPCPSNTSIANSSDSKCYSHAVANSADSCLTEHSNNSSTSNSANSAAIAQPSNNSTISHSANSTAISENCSSAAISHQSNTSTFSPALAQNHNSAPRARHVNKNTTSSSMNVSSSSSSAVGVPTSCPLFAVKVMDKRALAGRHKLLRAQTEREILEALDHPFLPTLYAHIDERHFSCLVMEFCPGGDLHVLRQRQPSKRFCENAVRFYAAEVLLALEYLHMMGIVYRDLKPENVLVREDGHIMLSDFDLSLKCSVNPILSRLASVRQQQGSSSLSCLPSGKGPGSCELRVLGCVAPCSVHPIASCLPVPRFLSYLPRSGAGVKVSRSKGTLGRRPLPELIAEPTSVRSMSFVGTHEYLAPEIIIGDGHGSAVDWWTFGIFLFELLHGHTPFKGVDNEMTLMNVVTQPLKFPASSTDSNGSVDYFPSIAGQNLIRGLLVKDPNKRLAATRGASEVKQHPFFQGVNWALIRCAIPPEIPSPYVPIEEKYEAKQCLNHADGMKKHKWVTDADANSESFGMF